MITEHYSEQQLLELIRMRELDIFEQARAMQLLCTKHHYTQASLAKRLGVSQSCVGNKIRLLQFSASEQAQIIDHALSERHARALLRIQPPKREKLIATVGNMHLTVQQTEEIVEKYAQGTLDAVQSHDTTIQSISAEGFISQIQNGAERLRTIGYKTTCLTESGEDWHRITVTIVE